MRLRVAVCQAFVRKGSVHGASRVCPSQDRVPSRMFSLVWRYDRHQSVTTRKPRCLGSTPGQARRALAWGCNALPKAHLGMLSCIASCRAVSTASAPVESLLSQQIAFGIVVKDSVSSIVSVLPCPRFALAVCCTVRTAAAGQAAGLPVPQCRTEVQMRPKVQCGRSWGLMCVIGSCAGSVSLVTPDRS
jgi:hypothetical protein